MIFYLLTYLGKQEDREMSEAVCPVPPQDLYGALIHFHEPKYTVVGINQFWNTISNICYLIVGIQLCRMKNPLGSILICVGIFSTLFHATGRFGYEVGDEIHILFLIHTVLDNTRYHGNKWLYLMYPIYVTGLIFQDFREFYILLSSVSLIAINELKNRANYLGNIHHYNDMLGCLLIGKFFWFLEQSGYFWPGHSIWHAFSALAVGYAGLIIGS